MQQQDKRRRRRHLPEFKAAAVAACREPGVSVAAIALERQINANLLRTWIKHATTRELVARSAGALELPTTKPSFVPVRLDPQPSSPARSASTERPVRVQIVKGRTRITVDWPAAAAESCAVWLRELLR